MRYFSPLSAAARLLLVFAIAVTTTSAASAQTAAPWLRLHGSNTIGLRLAPALARAFAESEGWRFVAQRNERLDEYRIEFVRGTERAVIEIAAHGTGTGLEALLDGRADLWMASRPVSAGELARASALGRLDHPEQEHVIALDGLAIVVHPNNPLRSLSIGDVRRVFAGEVRNWKALGGSEGAIALHARDDRSGTFDTFRALVLADSPLAAGAHRYESSDELVAAVRADRGAIGFVGLDAVGSTRALAISDQGTRALTPMRMEVATEDYALARRLYLYAAELQSERVRQFIEFAQGTQGQSIATRIGFIGQQLVAEAVAPVPGMPIEYLALTEGAQRVSVNFRFDSGLTFLDGKALRDIARLSNFLEQEHMRRHEVALIGFSDAHESNPIDALLLSNDRADYIAQELNRAGVPVRKVRGMADAAPVASNDTAYGRSKNRRVEVWVRPRAAPGVGLRRAP
jgi:phosphate transport system substrate-binding protein